MKQLNPFEYMGFEALHNLGYKGFGKMVELEYKDSIHGISVCDEYLSLVPESSTELRGLHMVTHNGEIDFSESNVDEVFTDLINDNEVIIINASIGGKYDSQLEWYYKKLIDAGKILVTSAGNDSKDMMKLNDFHKSKYWISVTALNDFLQPKSYSNYGRTLDFSSMINSNREGTSYASPTVSAQFNIIKQIRPELNQWEVLELSKTMVKDLGNIGRDDTFGYGIIRLNYEDISTFDIKNHSLVYRIGSYNYKKNGCYHYTDTPPVISDTNRTMVPLRSISEALNCYVKWIEETKEIIIIPLPVDGKS